MNSNLNYLYIVKVYMKDRELITGYIIGNSYK